MTDSTPATAAPLMDRRYHVYGDYYDRVTAIGRDFVEYDIERGDGRKVGEGRADRDSFLESRTYADV